MSCRNAALAFLVALAVLGATAANAQWVFLARKAVGKIEQLTQPETKDSARYDVATVVIEGKAERVYALAADTLRANGALSITRQDPARGTIDFTDGARSVGLKISQVDDRLVHLLIASVIEPDRPSETSIALAATIRLCEAAGAKCTAERTADKK